MSEFQREFEKAVLEVSAEIDAMDDTTFAQMLAQHRDGDVAQILREIGPDFAFDELEMPIFEGKFSSDVARNITLQSPFQATNSLSPKLVTDPTPPEPCLNAA